MKIGVPRLADLLLDLTDPNSNAGLNGEFSRFCKMLKEHYRLHSVELPADAKTGEIAAALKKLGNVNMPSGEDRREFDKQVQMFANLPERTLKLGVAV